MSDLNCPSFYENESFEKVESEVVKNRLVQELEHVINMIKEQPVLHMHYTIGCELVDSSGIPRGFISQTTADFDVGEVGLASTDHKVVEFSGVGEQVARIHREVFSSLQMTYLETALLGEVSKEVCMGVQNPIWISLENADE